MRMGCTGNGETGEGGEKEMRTGSLSLSLPNPKGFVVVVLFSFCFWFFCLFVFFFCFFFWGGGDISLFRLGIPPQLLHVYFIIIFFLLLISRTLMIFCHPFYLGAWNRFTPTQNLSITGFQTLLITDNGFPTIKCNEVTIR